MSADPMNKPLLSVRGLTVSFDRGTTDAVSGIDLDVAPGECVALVGESGSGKSVTARALLGLAGTGSRVTAERLDFTSPGFESKDLRTLRPGQWRELRGNRMGLILQDALVSLDPLRPIGREIGDALRLHTTMSLEERRARVIELLESVGMPEAEIRVGQRSGELSGGLRQRAVIAAAIAAEPPLIIADEPTTALDVTVQAQVLDLLGRLTASGTALLLISHDLAVVSQLADRIAVMRDGEIVEQGPAEAILRSPQHPYTRRLLQAVPAGVPRGIRLTDREPTPGPAAVTTETPILEARGLVKTFARRGAPPLLAVDDVSFSLSPGRTLGLVGESGSGKTTVARIALGLAVADAGEVLLDGAPWSAVPERDRRARRNRIGAVYQDPLSSFDPRLTVDDILVDAVGGPKVSALRRVGELLDSVGLESAVRGRRPLHLSGGQRQRVAIARALAPAPRVIICDEPVSALDVSVQAQVLDLLDELQASLGVAYLFISHDLDVVRHMSDTVAVMSEGRIVESGEPDQIFEAPAHDYTRRLLAAAPRLRPRPSGEKL